MRARLRLQDMFGQRTLGADLPGEVRRPELLLRTGHQKRLEPGRLLTNGGVVCGRPRASAGAAGAKGSDATMGTPASISSGLCRKHQATCSNLCYRTWMMVLVPSSPVAL